MRGIREKAKLARVTYGEDRVAIGRRMVERKAYSPGKRFVIRGQKSTESEREQPTSSKWKIREEGNCIIKSEEKDVNESMNGIVNGLQFTSHIIHRIEMANNGIILSYTK